MKSSIKRSLFLGSFLVEFEVVVGCGSVGEYNTAVVIFCCSNIHSIHDKCSIYLLGTCYTSLCVELPVPQNSIKI